MPPSRMLCAWVDESIVPAHAPLGDGAYLLAATTVTSPASDEIRGILRTLNGARATKLHWKDERPNRRRGLAEALEGIDAHHSVVVGAPIDARKQERARRQCMERLVFELGRRNVALMTLETRTAALNRRDMSMFDSLRRRSIMPATMQFSFAHADVEPLLWLPDIVAGATGAMLRDLDAAPFESLASRIDVIDLELG